MQLLDKPTDSGSHSSWWLDQEAVVVDSICDCNCQIDTDQLIYAGQTLTQKRFVADTADIHREFVSLWQPRWQKHASLLPDHWHRALAFAHAFLPRGLFLPPRSGATSPQLRVVLMAMPRSTCCTCTLRSSSAGLSSCFLELSIVSPRSVRRLSAHSHFQGSVCAVCLNPFMTHSCPTGRPLSTGTLCRRHDSLGGATTDIVKAFNNLPKAPIFAIAKHTHLVNAWAAFLASFERRFDVRGSLSAGLRSNCGFKLKVVRSVSSSRCA